MSGVAAEAHAFALLKYCFAMTKLLYVLRKFPTHECKEELARLDKTLAVLFR